ncbi:MerR family transcriptional regulator [Deinococcus ficus]|uniref:MerR family transcriptional regulator n=1 Tax=Deinococcus ficus TaxID=317577 RepID=UPI0003B3E76F|nr:MerR family transcriptional regulator [Deinococcus ficus]GHF72039.1 MerR family transcriptional regulator [Deinococcus ficus]
MRIGELAKASGVSVRALRHYDALNLLSPVRSDNGYRAFTEDDLRRVKLIRLFLSVGFRLEEIREYGPCWQGGADLNSPPHLPDTLAFYERKLHDIDAQIAGLQAVRERLRGHMEYLQAPPLS